MKGRRDELAKVLTALRLAIAGRQPEGKIVASRYGPGMSGVGRTALKSLADDLSKYADAVHAASEAAT